MKMHYPDMCMQWPVFGVFLTDLSVKLNIEVNVKTQVAGQAESSMWEQHNVSFLNVLVIEAIMQK